MIISDFKLLEKVIKPYKIRNLYHFTQVLGFSIDSRKIKKGQAFIAITGKHFDGHDFIKAAIKKGAACVISQKYISTNPKVPFFIVQDSYAALANICRFIRKTKKPFVYAITGSVGKSTTKEMLSFILESHRNLIKSQNNENNLLGVAKTILSLHDEDTMVLELGTNKAGEIEELADICLPDVGVVTFIKPSHLKGLNDLKGVLKEKTSFLKNNKKIKPVLNRDDDYLRKLKLPQEVYWAGIDKSSTIYAKKVKNDAMMSTFLINGAYPLTLPFYQEHFITNALLALASASLLKVPLKDLVERMNNYRNVLPGRMQIREQKKAVILNDAYNANPYSCVCTLKAIKKYPHKKIAVLADMLELGPESRRYHVSLAKEIVNNNFDYCLTFGKHSYYLRQKLCELGFKNAHHFSSHQDIAQFINAEVLGSIDRDKRCLILLKGSRSMELEKVTKYL
jgi:UDP-N-acetylmuramoyl-tripeptide--D-alanyl-D-alanine ligase